MSAEKKIIIRVQSSEGTQRVEVLQSDSTSQLYEKVYNAFNLNNYGFILFKKCNKIGEIRSGKVPISEFGLEHGDKVYLEPINGTVLFDQAGPSEEPIPSSSKGNNESTVMYDSLLTPTIRTANVSEIEEHPVDKQLYKEDGKIQRSKDEKLCRHGANARCVHCSPLEPFDEAYLKQHNIKHMSFHAHLRKLTSGVDRGKFIALEETSCKIKPGCKEHPPWPRGICSKCQPSAVTLNQQTYRHVDNVMFESKGIVERFLEYWRLTGHQRIGFLYGVYEKHPDVPLGIRARVASIYEPPQMSSRDSIQLLGEGGVVAEAVDALAARLGLTQVGWIFTDLLSEDTSKGTVQHVRGVDSHFLSAQECIMAGYFQNQHPNACRYANSGYFGSKYVTVCVTGDSNKQVHMEGYQVSGQCTSLVRDGCLLPTKDAPELGYIRESSDKQYVPDVYYKEKDAYGNEVQCSARRLPVAYLLVDVPTGLGRGQPTLAESAFPPANRPLPGHIQGLRALHAHVRAAPNLLEAMSDLHVLAFLATNDALPLSLETLAPLAAAVRARDAAAAEAWARATDWATLLQLMAAASDDAPAQEMHSDMMSDAEGGVWTCPHCTFDNPAHTHTCDMCLLPRGNM